MSHFSGRERMPRMSFFRTRATMIHVGENHVKVRLLHPVAFIYIETDDKHY